MPQVACVCGYTFRLGRSSSPDEHILISDSLFNTLEGVEEAVGQAEALLDRVSAEGRSVLVCPECFRVLIQAAPDSADYTVFRKEE